MIVLWLAIAYAFIGAVIGGVTYAILEHTDNSDPEITGSMIGAFWPIGIFVGLFYGIYSLTTWFIKEKTDPRSNV